MQSTTSSKKLGDFTWQKHPHIWTMDTALIHDCTQPIHLLLPLPQPITHFQSISVSCA